MKKHARPGTVQTFLATHADDCPPARYATRTARWEALAEIARRQPHLASVTWQSIYSAERALERRARFKARSQRAAETRRTRLTPQDFEDDITSAIEQAVDALTKVEAGYKTLKTKLATVKGLL